MKRAFLAGVILIVVLAGYASRHRINAALEQLNALIALRSLPAIDAGVAERLPNLLVISLDTLRKSDVGVYTPSLATTPNLAGRLDQFVLFDGAITAAPWTGPSHLALFYSKRPPVAFWQGSVLSMTEILRHYGYQTAGFTDGGWLGKGGGVVAGMQHLEEEFHEAGTGAGPLDDKIEQIDAWLDAASSAPFLMLVHTYHTHLPYDPIPSALARFHRGAYEPTYGGDTQALLSINQQVLAGESVEIPREELDYIRALYRAEILEADAFVEDLFALLERRGVWKNTVVVLTSDHGESFFERGFFDHGTGLHDELINVPLLLKPASSTRATAPRVDRQVELLDIPPTFFDLAGIPIPGGFQGRSFASLFTDAGQPYEKLHAVATVAETKNYGEAKQAIRTNEWKYIFHATSGTEELYRLTVDPDERANLIDDEPDVAAELRVLLQQTGDVANLKSPERPTGLGKDDQEILKTLGYIE